MTAIYSTNYQLATTTANGFPTYDDLMAAVKHISDVMGTLETPTICHGDDCKHCFAVRAEWTEIWDTVHRILDPDFKERWVEVTGDNP